MTRFFFVLTFYLFSHVSYAQFLKKDSLLLASVSGEKIMKIVAKNDKKNLISIGWYTKTDTSFNLFVQNFTYEGKAVSPTIRIVQTKITKSYWHDFDFAIDTDTLGNTLIAWSEYDSASNKFKIMYSGIDPYGRTRYASTKVETSGTKFVKTSINKSGQFLISWYDSGFIKIQLFNRNYLKVGNEIFTYYESHYYDKFNKYDSPVQLSDSIQVALTLMTDQPPRGIVRIFDSKGSVVYRGNSVGSTSGASAIDGDYADDKTVLSFSRKNSGTFISIISRYNDNQGYENGSNSIGVDSNESTITHIKQNASGSILASWKNVSNEVKVTFMHNSGQPISDPIGLWKDNQNIRATSFDAILRNNHDALMVYALEEATKSSIVLQKIQFLPKEETKEIIASPRTKQNNRSNKSLSSNKTHVVVWQTKEDYKSAILAQIYDKNFNKVGDAINITGFKNHVYLYDDLYFDFECAIDTVGNFMIAWSEYSSPRENINRNANIYAIKYDAFGNAQRDLFQVNQPLRFDESTKFPKVASTSRGDFLIFWQKLNLVSTNSTLIARLIGKESDGQEKNLLKESLSNYFSYWHTDRELAMNDSGAFVIAYKSGYYSFGFLIFDQNMELISNFSVGGGDTFSKFDLAFGNQGKIDFLFTNDNYLVNNSFFSPVLFLRTYDFTGKSISDLLLDSHVQTYSKPDLAVNQKGDYCALYRKNNSFLVQRFESNGQKVGKLVKLNTFWNGSSEPRISYNSCNEIFGSWWSNAYVPNDNQTYDIIIKGIYNSLSGMIGKDFEDNFILPKPPVKPKSLVVNGDYSSRSLLWQSNTEPYISGYSVYRNTVNDTLTASAVGKPSSAAFTDSKKITTTGTLSYWVKASNNLNQSSFFSDAAQIFISTTPEKPKALSVKGDYENRTLSWIPNTEVDIAGYSVYRNNTNDTLTASKIGNSPSVIYNDNKKITTRGTLYYWVKAYNKLNQSSFFGNMSQLLITIPPEKPRSLTVKGDYETRLLSWMPNRELDLVGYSVYRNTANDTLSSFKIGSSSSANFTDATKPQTNEILYYWIRAYNKANQLSKYSDVGYILVSEIFGQSGNHSIFPNPTDDKLYFDSELLQSIKQIDVIDMLGNRHPQKYDTMEPCISIGSMVPGLYYIVITTDKIQISNKIVKR